MIHRGTEQRETATLQSFFDDSTDTAKDSFFLNSISDEAAHSLANGLRASRNSIRGEAHKAVDYNTQYHPQDKVVLAYGSGKE